MGGVCRCLIAIGEHSIDEKRLFVGPLCRLRYNTMAKRTFILNIYRVIYRFGDLLSGLIKYGLHNVLDEFFIRVCQSEWREAFVQQLMGAENCQ